MKKSDWLIFESKYNEIKKDLEEDIEVLGCLNDELLDNSEFEDIERTVDLIKEKFCDLSLFKSLEEINELFDVKGVIDNE